MFGMLKDLDPNPVQVTLLSHRSAKTCDELWGALADQAQTHFHTPGLGGLGSARLARQAEGAAQMPNTFLESLYPKRAVCAVP